MAANLAKAQQANHVAINGNANVNVKVEDNRTTVKTTAGGEIFKKLQVQSAQMMRPTGV
jgi:hypothetical protein